MSRCYGGFCGIGCGEGWPVERVLLHLRHQLTGLLFFIAAGLRTTAELSDDGSHYIVNGTKKWISNAIWSDYIVTGCRTKKGFSVLLVEKKEGVSTKLIKTSYSTAAATSFIEFDNVIISWV